jgi:hypothetical protein
MAGTLVKELRTALYGTVSLHLVVCVFNSVAARTAASRESAAAHVPAMVSSASMAAFRNQ